MLRAVDKTEGKSRRETKEKFKMAEEGGKDKRAKEQQPKKWNQFFSLGNCKMMFEF